MKSGMLNYMFWLASCMVMVRGQDRQVCTYDGHRCKVFQNSLYELVRPSVEWQPEPSKKLSIMEREGKYIWGCANYNDMSVCNSASCVWDDDNKVCAVHPEDTFGMINSGTFDCESHEGSTFLSCAVQRSEETCKVIGCEVLTVDPTVVGSGYYRLMNGNQLCVSRQFASLPNPGKQAFISTLWSSSPISACPEARAKLAYFTLCAYRGRDSCVADPMCWWSGDMCLTRDMVTLSVMWGTIPQAKVVSEVAGKCMAVGKDNCDGALRGEPLPKASWPQLPPLTFAPIVGLPVPAPPAKLVTTITWGSSPPTGSAPGPAPGPAINESNPNSTSGNIPTSSNSSTQSGTSSAPPGALTRDEAVLASRPAMANGVPLGSNSFSTYNGASTTCGTWVPTVLTLFTATLLLVMV